MTYKVAFTIDDGCKEKEHIAIVNADSSFEAIRKLEQHIVLGYDEYIPHITAEPIKSVKDILYCSHKCVTVDIKNLPKKFSFKSNINHSVDRYHAEEKANAYVVTTDDTSCSWRYDKTEMHEHLLNGDFVIIKEESK